MLTQDQKNQMIDARLQRYAAQIYELELDIVALQAIGDADGVEQTEKRIFSLKRASTEIEKLKETDNAGS